MQGACKHAGSTSSLFSNQRAPFVVTAMSWLPLPMLCALLGTPPDGEAFQPSHTKLPRPNRWALVHRQMRSSSSGVGSVFSSALGRWGLSKICVSGSSRSSRSSLANGTSHCSHSGTSAPDRGGAVLLDAGGAGAADAEPVASDGAVTDSAPSGRSVSIGAYHLKLRHCRLIVCARCWVASNSNC